MDGTRLSEHVESVRGTAATPMTRSEVVDKARDLIAPVIGNARSSQLVDTVLSLEAIADVRVLRSLLQRR